MLFNDKLQQIATSKHLSNAEIAKRCHTSEAQIHYLMTGKTKNPGLKIIIALSNALEVEPGELLNDVELPTD